jgi:hypothetical protein
MDASVSRCTKEGVEKKKKEGKKREEGKKEKKRESCFTLVFIFSPPSKIGGQAAFEISTKCADVFG